MLQKIGFTALPMMMNARHLRLNYYTRPEFEQNFGAMRQGEHAHGLHDKLQSLPQALKHPLAVVANMTPNAKPGSVVAITDMDINGQKVVVPVLIEANNNVAGEQIDSHLVLTVYDSGDWINDFLTPAIKAEKNGIGIFYFDEKKAARYSAYSKKIGAIPTGFVHNIAQAGINVKPQTETLQFKKWFEGSQVVDKDGKPQVVYHASDWDALREAKGKAVFDLSRLGENTDGNATDFRAATAHLGFHFNNQQGVVKEKTFADQELACYLKIKNPYHIENIDDLAYFVEQNGGAEAARSKLKSGGYDGIIYSDDEFGGVSYVVFDPEQIKSATDNIGTFDPKNKDIRYSLADEDDGKIGKLGRLGKIGTEAGESRTSPTEERKSKYDITGYKQVNPIRIPGKAYEEEQRRIDDVYHWSLSTGKCPLNVCYRITLIISCNIGNKACEKS